MHNATPPPSLSPTNSFSGSPPIRSLIASVPLQPAVSPVESSVSDVARAKLAELTEFLPTPSDPKETPISKLITDTKLCEALKEIDSRIIQFLHGKLSNKGLCTILDYLPALQSINLSGFHNITEEVLHRIAEYRQLTSLNLSATKVTNLGPLNEKPLPFLSEAKFFETPVDAKSLYSFLQRHKITKLTLPPNLPAGFLLRCLSDHLAEVTLQMNWEQYPEVLAFLQQARSLKKLDIYPNTVSPNKVPMENMMELVRWGAQLSKEVTFILPSGTISFTKY